MKRFAFVALLAFVACSSSQTQVSGDLRTVGSTSVTFRVAPAVAKIGQPVQIAFRLVNFSAKVEQLTYPSSQRYDFWATKGTSEVWRWSTGRAFDAEITKDPIESQGTRMYSQTWTPRRAGRYVIHGTLIAEGFAGEMRGKLVVQ